MKKFPGNWVETKLENVLENIVGGGTPSKANSSFFKGDIPFMTVKDMKKRFLSDTIDHISEEAITASATTLVPADTLIVATRMSLGKIVRATVSTAINQDLKALFPFADIDKTYFEYFWRSKSNVLMELGAGTTVKGIRLDDIKNIKIPLAPSNEQKRISVKLDSVLSRVDICQKRLSNIQKILKRFRQSVLVSAISGRLTYEWRIKHSQTLVDVNNVIEELFIDGITAGNFGKRNDRAPKITEEEKFIAITNDCAWPIVRIGSICACIVPNRTKPKSFGGNFHWLLTQHVDDNSIFINYENVESGLTESEAKEFSAKIIPVNSVVMTCIGRLGLSAVLDEASIINQQLHAFLPNRYVLSKFLAYVIRANKEYYDDISTSTTVSYLNKTACNSLPIPLPQIDEQRELIRRIETLFAFADRLEARLATACTAVDRLTPALLAKAFRGELVPQDPADEPASELLARLAASRAAEVAKPRRARTVKA